MLPPPVSGNFGFTMGTHDHLADLLEDSLGLDDVSDATNLIGAIIADKVPNIGGIKGSLRAAWSKFGNFQVSYLNRNLFSIKMNPVGAEKVLDGGPWHVRNFRFNVVPWPGHLAFDDVPTHLVPYWVQVSGLSLEKMNVKNAQLIGSEIGVLLDTDDPTKVDAALRGYLRVKVAIDSRKPLPTGFWRPLSETTKRRVYYSYEGLCHFCFKCGRLGHLEDACGKCKSSDPPELQQERSWYGPWMAVDAPKSPHSSSAYSTRVNRKKPQSF